MFLEQLDLLLPEAFPFPVETLDILLSHTSKQEMVENWPAQWRLLERVSLVDEDEKEASSGHLMRGLSIEINQEIGSIKLLARVTKFHSISSCVLVEDVRCYGTVVGPDTSMRAKVTASSENVDSFDAAFKTRVTQIIERLAALKKDAVEVSRVSFFEVTDFVLFLGGTL